MKPIITLPLICAGLLLAALPIAAQQPIAIATFNRDTPVSFEKEIAPIFQKNCLACHSDGDASGELVLESPQSMLKGGDSGPAIVPGKSAESLLLQLAAHQMEPLMPPPDNKVAAKSLTPQELGLVQLWINQGAKGAASAVTLSPQRWHPLPAGNHPIYTLALSPDGQFAACGRANQIFIYHVPTGQLVTRLSDPALEKDGKDNRPGIAHLDIVQSLAFSKQGDLLASGGFRTVKLWRYPRDVQQLKFTSDAAMTALAVSPDRKTFAVGQEDNKIRLWSLAPTETGAPAEPAILAGHAGAIHGLSFTSDGAKLLSTAADKTVRVWNVADAQPAGRIDLPADANGVTALMLPAPAATDAAVEPPADVEHLATAGADNLIRLWRMPTALPQALADAPEKTSELAVSPDGTLLAMANAQGLVRVVRARSNELVHQWQAHKGPILALALHIAAPAPAAEAERAAADAAAAAPQIRLAAAGEDGTVHVFDAGTGQKQLVLRGSLTAIDSIDFSPDGKQLVAGAADGCVTLWNLEPIEAAPALSKGDAAATVAVVSPDGKLLATNGTSGGRPAILVRDLESGKLLHTLLGHDGPVAALAFSNDNTRIASGSADKTARVWDLRDAKFPQAASFTGHAGAVTAVALNADATQVVSGAGDNTLKLWTVADVKEVMNFAGHTGPILGVAFGPGNQLISASADKTVRYWNPANGQAARTVTEAAAIGAFALSPDGTKMSAALADKTIKIYNAADGNVLFTLAGHEEIVHSLAFSGDGMRLVSGAADGRAMVWEVADGRLLEILPVEGLAAATYGAAADRVIATDAQGAAAVYSMRFAGALKGMAKPVSKVAYHPNGQLVLAACEDGTIRGYNPTTYQQAFAANHGAAVHDLAIRGDGQLMASAGEDKLVKLWNPANGAAAQPAQLAGFAAPVQSVAFTDDGARVIGAGGGEEAGEILVFNIAPPSGLLEQSIVGHAGIVQSCVSLGEAGRMVSAAADGSLLAWEALAVRHIAGHSQPVTAIAAIPRQQPDQPPELLSGSLDGTVRRWNALTGQALAQLNHGGPVTSVAVRWDGQRWASASNNNTLKLWNAANNQQIAQMQGDIRAQTLVADLTGQKNDAANKVTQAKAALDAAQRDLPVKTTAEATAATALAAADRDVEAKSGVLTAASTTKANAEKLAIDAAALAQQSALAMEAANQLALEMTAKARLLAESAERMRAQAAAAPEDTKLAKAHADAMAASVAADAQAKAAEAAKAAPTKTATDTAQAAAAAAQQAVAMAIPFNDADTALAASQTAQRTAKQLHEFAARDLKDATAAVPAAQATLAEVEVLLKKLESDVTAATAAEQQSQMPIHAVAFSPDGRTLASGGDFGVVHTWDAETGKAVSSYVGHEGPIAQVAYASDGALLSVAADKSAVVWEPNPSWQLERVIGDISDPSLLIDRVSGVDFNPEGKLLVVGGGVPSRSGELKIFNVADGKLVREIPEPHTDAVASVAFSPDGRFVASAGADKYVKKWDVASGQLAMQFEGHTNYVTSVAWRAGGNVLASAGSDSTIRIWDAVTGDRIRTIAGFSKQVSSVRFVGATQFIVSSAGDPLVRMHNTDNGGVQVNYGGPAEYMFAVDAVGDQTNGVVVAGGFDGILRIWQANGQLPRTIGPPEPEPTTDQQAGSE